MSEGFSGSKHLHAHLFSFSLCVSLRLRYAQEVSTDRQFMGRTPLHTYTQTHTCTQSVHENTLLDRLQ